VLLLKGVVVWMMWLLLVMVECKMGERTRILEGVMMMLRYLLVMAVLKAGQPKMKPKMNPKMVMIILERVMLMLRYLLVMAVLKMGQPKMNQKMVMMIWQMLRMRKWR